MQRLGIDEEKVHGIRLGEGYQLAISVNKVMLAHEVRTILRALTKPMASVQGSEYGSHCIFCGFDQYEGVGEAEDYHTPDCIVMQARGLLEKEI